MLGSAPFQQILGVHFGEPPAQEKAQQEAGRGGEAAGRLEEGGPVFVPIVMKMADADHDMLLRQHYSPKVRRLQCSAL